MKDLLKFILTATIAISIYDTSDPSKVRIEGCLDHTKTCVDVIFPKDKLDDPKALDTLSDFIATYLYKHK